MSDDCDCSNLADAIPDMYVALDNAYRTLVSLKSSETDAKNRLGLESAISVVYRVQNRLEQLETAFDDIQEIWQRRI